MELVFFIVLSVVLWVHSWYLLGFFVNSRTIGLTAGAAAVALVLLALLRNDFLPAWSEPPSQLEIEHAAAVTSLLLLWAFYAVLVAGTGIWGFEERSLGFYSLLLAVFSLLMALVFFVGDVYGPGLPDTKNAYVAIASIVLGVLALLLFFHLAIPFRRLRVATGWSFFVGSLVLMALGVLGTVGLLTPPG
mgnify:CR=1 FL=1